MLSSIPRRFSFKHLAASLLVASSLACGPASRVTLAQTGAVPTPLHWVGTWGNSSPTGLSPTGYNNQTLRLTAHTSVGASRVRVRLTNLFGTRPLTIGAAHIALRGANAEIQGGSDRVLTFSGQTAIAIPKGAVIVSDPVDLPVPTAGDLAVSIWLPEDTGPVTYHAGVPKTSYVSTAGNHAADVFLPVASTTTTLPILSDIEVLLPATVGSIVCLGDSITQGFRSTTDQDNRWSDFLAYRLLTAPPDANPTLLPLIPTVRGLAVVNEGISGNRLLHDIAGPNLVARFDTDVLVKVGVSHVIVLIGINDITNNGTDDARLRTADPNNFLVTSDFIAAYKQLITRAHDRGIKIFGGTITPRTGNTEEMEAMRQGVNQYIRTSGEFDGVVDFDAAIRDPNNPRIIFAPYDSGDGLHPSDAGYQAMGYAINLNFFK